ncbi:hypothetical protein J7T55_012329 [Diaporthe amygdali]|uniref:uncharacterized protein n=1 Tax=Phomopsis amygdali TaxID=1214568 RepID=UPI0022FDD7F7|nr:uncharacterized protein J7T55_012329 [Diaporthe amygdali]KAJ0123858.1 hypothetical protein J7T55_012329 [Diaporthe amygdali]
MSLAAVNLCAGEGSISQRRSGMPDNSTARGHQAELKLSDNAPPTEPLTYSRSLEEANPGDSPLPPPAALLRALPDFSACKPDECGGYYDHSDLDDQQNSSLVDCRKCGNLEPQASMHRLPCGHQLCNTCLSITAINATAQAHCTEPCVAWRIGEVAGELGRLRRDLVPRDMTRLRVFQEARMGRYRRELLELLGLSCCGLDMKLLERFMPCLDEWVARSLWAATWELFRGAGQEGTMRCGWHDCGAAVPIWCTFEMEHERRWHCPACGGNSMRHSQRLGPAR